MNTKPLKQFLPEWRFRKLQWLRRTVQFAVVAFIVIVPILGHYGNYLASRELDALLVKWQGSPQGVALKTVDTVLRTLPGGERERVGRLVRDDDKALARIQPFRGSAWSAQIHGVSVTDPLAAAESFAASRRVVNVMILSLIIPLAVTLLLGRIFCSWLCPIGLLLELSGKLRGLLRFLELPSFNVRFPRATKFILLSAGLMLAYLWAMPVLGSLYPPAIFGREVTAGVSAMFERAETISTGWTWTGFGVASIFVVGIVLFELMVSERWWCRYVCPGGALYSLLGRWRPVRVKRSASRCTSCGDCVQVCGMGLAPMSDQMGMECDNCGLCISHCDDKALAYTVARPGETAQREKSSRKIEVLLVLLGVLFAPQPLAAHHILGIPHYDYDESYPQAPVITYRTLAEDYEVRMTGYPGHPVPGERTSLHVYLSHRHGGKPFDGNVILCVMRDGLLGEGDTIYGPTTAERSEGVFKFFPTFDREDNFLVRIDFSIDDVPWTIDLPVVVGEPGSPLFALGAFAAGFLALLVVVRAIRIKIRRRDVASSVERVNP